ncbi:MAG TPA: hypothetical protein VNK04_00840, partial [Gemmataceae bacterium]|nr:hypothetical protein [Gemmataceae bacterium]
MNIHAEPFWVPKQGHHEEEYEDAVWPPEPRDYPAADVHLAIADGATESSYARDWARLLVQAVGQERLQLHPLPDGTDASRTEYC